MEELKFLRSPYLQELPIGFIEDKVCIIPNNAKTLLLDILKQDIYLIDNEILENYRPLKNSVKKSINNAKISNIDFFHEYNYFGIEIEINSNCNFRCRFCPVSLYKNDVQYMSLVDYRRIINEAVINGIKEVSLNHYSEPTIAPHFLAMVLIAVKSGLSVAIFTNGSNLSSALVKGLSKVSDKVKIIINFPEFEETQYLYTTQSKLFSKVVSNINYAKTILTIQIVINNRQPDIVHGVNKLFPGILTKQWDTDDRAGAIPNTKYAQPQFYKRHLNGCPLATRYINVSVNGDVFLCAQDYFKKNVFGNILKSSLFDIINNSIIRQYRRWIFGAENPKKDFICRRCRWTRSYDNNFTVGAELSDIDLELYKSIVKNKKNVNIVNINGCNKIE